VILALSGYPQTLFAARPVINPADEEIFELIDDTRNFRSPGISAFHLLYEESYTITHDNRILYTQHVATKILSKDGLFASQVSLPYNDSAKLTINFARTIGPNKAITPLSPVAILDQAIEPENNTAQIDRIKVIPFPNVKVGSIVEYKAQYELPLENLPRFSGIFKFPLNWFVTRCRFSVEAPIGMILNYKTILLREERPNIYSTATHNIYSWQFDKVWVNGSFEKFLPAYSRFAPFISFTTITNWEDAAGQYRKLFQSLTKPRKAIHAQTDMLLKGATQNRDAAITMIADFIRTNIKPARTQLPVFSPHFALKVLFNRSGDSKDRAVLFLAMLKAAGIAVYPVLSADGENNILDKDLPSVMYDKIFVALGREEGGYDFIDLENPSSNIFAVSDEWEGQQGLLIKDNNFEMVQLPTQPPDSNKIFQTTHLTIYPDGFAQLNSKTVFSGRALENRPTDPRSPENTSITEQKNIWNYCRKKGRFLICPLTHSTDAALMERINQRRRAVPILITPYLKTIEQQTTVTIPQGYRLKAIPENIFFNMPVIKAGVKFTAEGDKIFISDTVTLLKKDISDDDHTHLKIIFDKIERLYRRGLTFEKI